LLASSVIDYELSWIKDEERFEEVQTLYVVAKEWTQLSLGMEKRARELQRYGIKVLDSFHLALAEEKKTDIFLTTDVRLLRAANYAGLEMRVSNPVIWLMEVL
jgi:predicted nucleic acid-binding protein